MCCALFCSPTWFPYFLLTRVLLCWLELTVWTMWADHTLTSKPDLILLASNLSSPGTRALLLLQLQQPVIQAYHFSFQDIFKSILPLTAKSQSWSLALNSGFAHLLNTFWLGTDCCYIQPPHWARGRQMRAVPPVDQGEGVIYRMFQVKRCRSGQEGWGVFLLDFLTWTPSILIHHAFSFSLPALLHSWLTNFQSSVLHPFSSSPKSVRLSAQRYRWGDIQSPALAQQEEDRPADPQLCRQLPKAGITGVLRAQRGQEKLCSAVGRSVLGRFPRKDDIHSGCSKVNRYLSARHQGRLDRELPRQRELQEERHRRMNGRFRTQGQQSLCTAGEEAPA